jgi:hypothetical protein
VKLKIIFLFLGTILFVGLPIYFLPKKIIINNFSCESQFGPCDQKKEEKIRENVGKNLSDAKKAVNEFLESEPLVSDFETHYKIPDTLEVNILLRKPRFGVTFNSSKAIALIDDEGYVVAYKEGTFLPILEANEAPPQVGEKVSDSRLFALELLNDMYTYYQIRKGIEQEDSVKFGMVAGKDVIFPLEGDRQLLIASLAVILTRLNADDSSTRIENAEGIKATCLQGCTIDLRFKNPVIR